MRCCCANLLFSPMCDSMPLLFIHVSLSIRSISHIFRIREKCCAMYCCVALRFTLVSLCVRLWWSFRAIFHRCLVLFCFVFELVDFLPRYSRSSPFCHSRISPIAICIFCFSICCVFHLVEFWGFRMCVLHILRCCLRFSSAILFACCISIPIYFPHLANVLFVHISLSLCPSSSSSMI